MLLEKQLENGSNFAPPDLSECVTRPELTDIRARARLGKFEVARLILSYIENGKQLPCTSQIKRFMCYKDHDIENLDKYFEDIENHFREIFG
jgi:hypothetical protein